jgi:hypothetical protein
MEDVSVASGRPPELNRPESSAALFLTFRGTREQKVRDRDTRIKIALGVQAARLWRLLGEQLTHEDKASDRPLISWHTICLLGGYAREGTGLA